MRTSSRGASELRTERSGLIEQLARARQDRKERGLQRASLQQQPADEAESRLPHYSTEAKSAAPSQDGCQVREGRSLAYGPPAVPVKIPRAFLTWGLLGTLCTSIFLYAHYCSLSHTSLHDFFNAASCHATGKYSPFDWDDIALIDFLYSP